MKKFLMIAAIFVGQLFASESVSSSGLSLGEGSAAAHSKTFTGADGQSYSFHFANQTEIQELNDPTRISVVGKDMHIPRVSENLVRIAIVNDTFMFAGRQNYGVTPYQIPSEEGASLTASQVSDNARLDVILNAFRTVAALSGIAIHDEPIVEKVKWLNPVHAATVIIGDVHQNYNTYSFHQSFASLIEETGYRVARNAVANSNDIPFFLLNYTDQKPTGDESAKTRTIQLPINGGLTGWKWASFTRIDGQDIPAFPQSLIDTVQAYRNAQLSASADT